METIYVVVKTRYVNERAATMDIIGCRREHAEAIRLQNKEAREVSKRTSLPIIPNPYFIDMIDLEEEDRAESYMLSIRKSELI